MQRFYEWLSDRTRVLLEAAQQQPIIKSLLDTDWYKLTMGQVVFHNYPHAHVVYKFINRGKTVFPPDFDVELREQIQHLSGLKLKPKEINFLKRYPYIQKDYLDFLESYRYDPKQVSIFQSPDGQLDVTVNGPWAETIFWEIPLMALISELYYKMMGKNADNSCEELMRMKAERLSTSGVKWIDFGTRRRFGYNTQNAVNRVMSQYPGYGGTSNPHMAMQHGIEPVGTYAHESIMGMQGKHGFQNANKAWMHHWLDEYGGQLGVALTDTLTTPAFLKDFDYDLASRFMGVRHDSGDPYKFGEMMIQHYKKLGIDPRKKTIVFSDKLDTDSAIELHRHFEGRINTVFGIGTHLTNDCGHKALNIVVKIISIDFGEGARDVVKLSDESGKHTGHPDAIALAKKTLGSVDNTVTRQDKLI